MAINIYHPTTTIEADAALNLKSANSQNIELTPDSGLVNVNGNINITGNFTVQGTTTTINSSTSTLVDPIVLLGTDEDGQPILVDDGKDRGVAFFYNDGTVNKTGYFGYSKQHNDFRFIPDATINNEVVTGQTGTITVDRVNAGDVTISENTIVSAVANADLNLQANGTGSVKIDGRNVSTVDDSIVFAIVLGG